MTVAYVMINTAPDKMEAVLEEVKAIEGTVEAYMLYGVYDIVVEIESKNVEELKEKILGIRKLPYIISTLTLLVVG